MSPRKHARMIVAMLLALGVVIAVAFLAQPLVSGTSATTPAEPVATGDKGAATQANDLANSPTPDISANAPAADAEASPTNEEIQRQVSAAIPRAEQSKVDPNAEYEPGVVLISVRKGTTVDQLSKAIEAAGIKSVEHDSVELVVDGLMKAELAPNATIDDAIYELESTGVAQGAQPNYVYEIMEEQELALDEALDDDEPEIVDEATQDEAEVADDADILTTSDEPILTEEADAVEEQPDAPSAIDAQSTSPTAARDALNDTYASKQWNLDSIDALDAWEFPPLKNATTTVGVGVLDNGFNDVHEDIVDNVQSTYNATTGESMPVRCPPGTPDSNHGSHVAGIIGTTPNNEMGIGGIGFNHLRLSLVCLTSESDPSGITTDDVVRGFDYLITNKDQYNIRVANISLGARVDSIPKDDAILNKVDEAYGAGIVTVASAGNRTWSAIPPYINYPSDYETIVSVIYLRNTNSDDPKSVTIGENSNFNAPGETGKNISAPGTDIYSTYPNGYGEMSGTSMAAPHVASVVGLMFAVNPMLSASQAKSLLYNSARDIGDEGWDTTYGYGEVNAFTAVRAAAEGTIAGPEYLAVGSGATYTLGSNYEGWLFSSSDPDVLAIDEVGNATAVSAGITTVRASNGNATIVRQVTVLGPITGNTLVAKDGSQALAVATPDGCGSLSWSWSSSDESVATVTDNGVVYGRAVGETTITASLVSDPTVSLSCAITVYDAREGDVFVPVGREVTLVPNIPEGVESPTISWSSTNEQVATVDSAGKVSALRTGGSAVSCTIEQGDQFTNVWCVYAYGPIEGEASVEVNQSTQLTVAGVNDMPQEIQTGWTWSLSEGSDRAVAAVDENGVVTGHKLGTVTVIASRGAGENQVSFSREVAVMPPSFANAKVTIPRQTYSGQKLTPVPEVTLNGITLVAGTDYDVVDQDIVNAGGHTVTIRGKGIYQGEVTGVFVVEPMRLTPPKAVTGLVYNGLEQTGVPEGAWYTLRGDVTETDADVYLAIAEVTDKVNTCWENGSTECRIEWSIAPRSASELSITGLGSYVYNGTEHTPKPTVTWNGKELSEDDGDYDVSYESNVNAGTATVIITCEFGNFIGTKTATFSIAQAPYSVGAVTAADVKESLDPADVVLARADTSLPGRLALTETELSCGTNTYHWTFTPDDKNYAPSSGAVEVTVTAHAWGAPTYEWAKDDGSCTARRVCANNPAHVEEETAASVRKVTVEPTTEREGKATLAATFRNEAFKTQSKEISLPKLPKSGTGGSSRKDAATKPTNTSRVSKLPETSDCTQPVVPLVVAGTIALVLAALRRRVCERWRMPR